MTRERYFTVKEFKEAFFPNVPLEELEGDKTEEEIQEDLKRIVERATPPPKREIDSKKQPRV